MFDKKLERTILKRGCRTVYAHITSKLIAIAQVQIKLQILEELTDFLPERSDRKQQQQSTFYSFITQFHSPFPNSPLLYFIHVFNFHLRCASSSFSSEQKRPLEPISSAHGSRHCVKVRRNSVYTYNRRREHFLWARFKGHTLLYTFTPYTNVWEIYKVTDRRRAHVQFPWNIHENKPLSRRRETSSRVSCGLAQGRRRP